MVLCISTAAVAQVAPLVSPWQTHPVVETKTSYSCPAPAHLPVNFVTGGFYADNDPTHSIIDPVKQKAYQVSFGPMKHEGEVVVVAADAFCSTGSKDAARCVLSHLEAQAREGTLTGKMSSSQAHFVQGWDAGAEAISYLKIEGNLRATAARRTMIHSWLETEAKLTRNFYEGRMRRDGGDAQNHFY